MIKVAIVGARGYAGRELVRICLRHPEVRIVALTGTVEAPQSLGEVFPEFKHLHDMQVVPLDTDAVAREADAVFLALPHKVSQEHAGTFVKAGKLVIDLSADFRFNDVGIYEKTYAVPHKEPELAKISVYGLAEIYRDSIKYAQVVGVPGCYPTGALLGILPLIMAGIEVNSPIIVDSKSGVSGAGKKPTERTHFPECNESLVAYNVGSHRHQPEISEKINEQKKDNAGELGVVFTPHLVPMNRGILSTIYIHCARDIPDKELEQAFSARYKEDCFIRLHAPGKFPATSDVTGTNFCDIGWTMVSPRDIVVITAIDNLVKGAAGQAVQCLNICFKLPEDKGLTQ
jgi:N-acetyl-gamma-glutamyl-phosphate reductase